MIEEIRSMVRCTIQDFGYTPEFLVIGQDQFNRFAGELFTTYGAIYKYDVKDKFLGVIGEFEGLKILIVTSDILEVV